MRRRIPALWSSPALALLVLTIPASAAVRFQTSNFGKFVPRGAVSTAIADFDADGRLDLAVSIVYPSAFITLLRGAGDGSFAPVDSIPMTQNTCYSFASADLDLDGKLDLLAQSYGATNVLRGTGSFDFAAPVLYSRGGQYATGGHGLAVGNLFGDAHPEVVAPDTVGALVVWQVTGAAILVPTARLSVPQDVVGVALGDLDQDGDLDVVEVHGAYVNQTFDLTLGAFRNDGGGAFAALTSQPIGAGYWNGGLEVADTDGDGTLDVLAGGVIARGHGDGTFDAAQPYGNAGEAYGHIADLNGDGFPDLISSELTGTGYPQFLPSFMRVRLGTGIGLGPPRDWFAPVSLADFDTADCDGDGRVDVVATGYTAGQMAFFAGDGLGGFVTPRTLPPGGTPADLAVGDLDENGIPDVVALVPSQNRLRIFHGIGGGAFAPPIDITAPANTFACGVGDVNADGHPDVLALTGSGLSLFPGLGPAGLGPRSDLAIAGAGAAMTVTDVTGDGIADVVLATAPPSLSVYPGGGAFGSRTDYPLSGSIYSRFLRVGDVTGDAIPDVVLVTGNGAEFFSYSAFVIPGPVTPASSVVSSPSFFGISSSLPVQGVELIDTDGDAKRDLVLLNGGSTIDQLRRFPSDGSGYFTTADAPAFIGRYSTCATSADVDADGRTDFVFANGDGAWANVSLLQANGKFGPAEGFGIGLQRSARRILAADLSGDGRIDLLVANDTTITLLLQSGGSGLVGVPEAPAARGGRLAISSLHPTVVTEDAYVRFTLARRGAAAIDLFDVAGRRLLHEALGVLDAGDHERAVSLPARMRSGVFWLRLSQDAESAAVKGVVAR